MSTIELKEQLISKIRAEESDEVLQEWLRIMNSEQAFEVSDELLEGLDEIEAAVERGEYYTTEHAREEMRTHLENLSRKY